VSEQEKFRVLDLFAGIGGTAKGIQRFFFEHNIPFQYLAIENDPEVLVAHKKLNPFSVVFAVDAYIYLQYNDLLEFDFIWASPPCITHSRCNMFFNRKNPDMRLWELVKKLQQQNVPFVVENVQPYYTPPIKPTVKIGRHCFWSNKPILPFRIKSFAKDWGWMNIKDWEQYHEIDPGITEHIKDRMKRRQILRNMVHWSISYNIIKQILFPKQKQLEVSS